MCSRAGCAHDRQPADVLIALAQARPHQGTTPAERRAAERRRALAATRLLRFERELGASSPLMPDDLQLLTEIRRLLTTEWWRALSFEPDPVKATRRLFSIGRGRPKHTEADNLEIAARVQRLMNRGHQVEDACREVAAQAKERNIAWEAVRDIYYGRNLSKAEKEKRDEAIARIERLIDVKL